MAKRQQLVRNHGGGGSGDDDDENHAADPAASANTVGYYTSMLNNYDETKLTQKTYAKATEHLQQWIKKL